MFERMMPGIPSPRGKHGDTGNNSRSTPSTRKSPKTRRPRTARDFFFKSLPGSSGPYDVGSIDLEIPVEAEDFGIERDGAPALLMETVLFTIFYPIKIGSGACEAPDGRKEWSRQLWLSSNRGKMSRGYGHFSGVPKPFCQFFFTSTVGLTKLQAWRNSPLADHFPAEGNVHDSGPEIRDQAGESDLNRPPCFPVIYFSHGLGGTRTTYSALCSEYASYGWICCAIEHRDGSGPRTYVNRKDKHWRRVDYIHPKNGNDTMNDDETPTDHTLRNAQLLMRKREIQEMHKVMCRIAEGHGEDVASTNLRVKKSSTMGGTSRGLIGINWSTWKDRVRTSHVTMCGHSFGGATTISVARTPKMLEYIKWAIILDVWGQGMADRRLEDEQEKIGVPLLGIGSESFIYWEENLKLMFDLCKEIVSAGQRSWLLTIRGSFHLSFSDFGLLWPRLFGMMFKTNIPPQRVIDIVINASLEYFKEVMPAEINRWNRGSDEGLLRSRISNGWRHIKGKKNAWKEKMQQHDGDDNEIWMHYSGSQGLADDFTGLAEHRIQVET